MDDETVHLLRLRGHLQAAIESIDRMTPATEDELRVLSITAAAFGSYLPRTRADVVRFAEAVTGGDEAWIIARSVPGEHRIDAVYLASVPASVRKALGI